MLPGQHRITRSEEFAQVIRRGARAGRATLVVHMLCGPRDPGDAVEPAPSRVGLVVSKAVGGAVVRNRVARRLRHAVRDLLPTVPAGSLVVVRALPPAATAGSELTQELSGALAAARKRGRRR